MLPVLCCLALILAAGISAEPEKPVDNCARIGGRCLSQAECGDAFSTSGLCGKDSVCCNKVPLGERCTSFGGECIPDCPETILHLGAKSRDCKSGLNCCVWLI